MRVLEMLQESHPGIALMKSLAQRCVIAWAGQGYKRLLVFKKTTTICTTSPMDVAWQTLVYGLHRFWQVHWRERCSSFIIDAYSKLVEIHCMNTSMSAATIELLCKSFASLECPESFHF